MSNTETTPAKKSGIVITAFVLSLLGFICGLPAIAGLILGIIGLKKARSTGQHRGLAIAAIAISAAWIVLGIILVIVAPSQPSSNSNSTANGATSQTSAAASPPAQPETPSATPTQSATGPAAPASAVPSASPEQAYLDAVRSTTVSQAIDLIAKRSDASMVKSGNLACKAFDTYGALQGFAMFYGSMRVTGIEAPVMAAAAADHLCPALGVTGSQIAAYDADTDAYYAELAQTNTFKLMLSEAREQGAPSPDQDDVDLMKDAFLMCGVLNSAKVKPWDFFASMDGVQPPGSTPSILQYRGVMNSVHFYVCPESRYSPETVVKSYFDKYVANG